MKTSENQPKAPKNQGQLLSEEGEAESLGKSFLPPPFQLSAGSPPPAQFTMGENEEITDTVSALWQTIQPILKKRLSAKNRKRILNTLYQYPSATITDCWKNTEANQDTEKFLSKLDAEELSSYPREVTAVGQALQASTRVEWIQKILKKGKFKKYAENDKYKDGFRDEAFLIIALFQGLTIEDIDPSGAMGYADTLAGIVGKHRDFKSKLASDIAQDNSELAEFSGDEDAFVLAREETNDIVEKAYLSIAFKGRKSGDKNDKTQIKNGAMFYLSNSNSPEEAIEAYEILEGLPENALKEFMNRYAGLFDAIVYDLPDSYRAKLDFGLFDGADKEGDASPISSGQDFSRDVSGEGAEKEDLLTDLEKIFLLLQPGGTLAEDGSDLESRKTNSKDKPYIPSRKQVLIDEDLKARIRMSFELLAHGSDFGTVQDLIEKNAFHDWLWTDPAMADVLLFLLTADAKSSDASPLSSHIQTRALLCPDQAVLAQYGYANGAWGPVQEIDYSNAKDFKGGRMIRKGVLGNGDNKGLIGYGMGGENLEMDDFSLVKLQEEMGGHIMGLEFGEAVDPALATEYAEYTAGEGKSPVAGDTLGGALDININGYKASIKANNLPIEAMTFEMSDGITTSGPGFIAGLNLNVVFDEASKKEAKKNPNAAKEVIGTKMELGKVVLTNFKMIDSDSAMAIQHIEVSGLKADYNQALSESGPIEGAFGMNMVTTLLTHVFEILFFGMNSTFKALGHLVPEMADAPGNYTKELLEAMGADPALSLEFDALHISNIISESGDVWKDIELGETQMGLGGDSLAKRAQAAKELLESKDPLSAKEEEQIKHYQQIIDREKVRVAKFQGKITELEAKIQASPENDPQLASLQKELAKLQTMEALPFDMTTSIEYIDGWSMPEVVNLNDLPSDGSYDNLNPDALTTQSPTNASSSYPVPATKLHLSGNIMAQGYLQEDGEREKMELDQLSGIYQETKDKGASYDASETHSEFFLEVFDPEIKDQQADINEAMGFDLNKVLPDYARIYLNAEGNLWNMEINAPSIKIGDLPEMGGLTISSTSEEGQAYLELRNAKAVLEIELGAPNGDAERAGLTSMRSIKLQRLEGSQLIASNAKIAYAMENKDGGAEEIILTNDSAVFNAPVFTGLGISFDENLSMEQIDMNDISFVAQATQLSGLSADMYSKLVEANISTYTAKGFNFSMKSDPEGRAYTPLEGEDHLTGHTDLRKHQDVMSFGFQEGDGSLSDLKYRPKGEASSAESASTDQQKVDASANLGSISGSISNTNYTASEGDERESVHKESMTSLNANLPSLTVSMIDILDSASGLSVQGGANGGEVVLNNIDIKFRLESHTDGDGNPINTIYHIDLLSIGSINAADIQARMGKTPIVLDEPGVLKGIVLEGYHYDENIAKDGGYPLFPGSFDPGKGLEVASMYFQELTASTLNIKELASGKLYFKRLADEKGQDGGGFEYGVDNLTTESLTQEGDKAVEISLPGLGANITGTWMDDNTITSKINIPEILEIHNFDFFIEGDAAKGKSDLRIASSGEGPGQLVDMFADIEIKMSKTGGKTELSNVKITKLNIGQMNLPGIDITHGGNKFSIPAEFDSFINDIVIADLNIDLNTKKVTGSGTTGDSVLDVSVDKFSGDAIKSLTTSQTISANGASFNINDFGDLEIGLASGKIFMGETSFDTKDNPATADKEQHVKGYLSSLSESFPGLSMGETKVILNGLFDPDRDEDQSMLWSVLVKNPTLEELLLQVSELGEQGAAMGEYLSSLSLSGRVDGTFYLADEGNEFVLSTRKNMEGEKSDDFSSIVISEAIFHSHNFLQMMNGMTGPADPNAPVAAEPDYQIDGFDPEEVMEEYKKNNPGVDPNVDGLKMDRSFDFLNALEPSKGDQGTVSLTFWGQTATLPIESIKAPNGTMQHGYVDLNAFLGQINGPVYRLVKEIVEEETGGWFGSKTAALATRWMMGADLDYNGKYYLEVGNFNVVTLHPLPNMEYGVLDDDGRSLIRLSDLMTYAPHGIELPAGEDTEGAESYMKAFETLDTMFNGRSFDFSLNNVELDPAKMKNPGMLKGLKSDGENNPLLLNMKLGVDMDNTTGLLSHNHKKHYHGGPNDTFSGETQNKNGLDLDLGPIYIPGIDTVKDGMKIKSGPMEAEKVNFKLDDYRMKESSGLIQNLSMKGLELRIPKTKVKSPKKNKQIDPIFLHTNAEKAAEKKKVDAEFERVLRESRYPTGFKG